ncbi:MAG: hypothetical protein AB7P34_11920 [Vicinamibacterales bacterium]
MIARAVAVVLLAPVIAWSQTADNAAGFGTPSTVAAPDRVLGLLALPEVFGNGPGHPFEPASVSLFAAPGATPPVAAIEVDQHWSFGPPEVVGLGWLPAHAASGEPAVWFSARGC